MPSSGRCISLNESDAIELADLLTFLANWLSGTQQHTRADSLTTFVGHTAPRCIDDPAPDLMVFRAFMGDVTFAAPARVLRPAMRGTAEQFICPVAGHRYADTDRRHRARAR